MAHSVSEAARLLHRSVLLCKVEAVRVVTLFRSSHILLDPQWRPPCWHAGHVARIHSINVLLAPVLTCLKSGNDRCDVDQAGTVSDCSNGWDFLSDRIYQVVMDGGWKTRGRLERKLAALLWGWGAVKRPPMRQEEKLGIWQELRESRVIWLQVLNWHSFSSYYLRAFPGERAPSREPMNGSIKSSVVCSWLRSIWPFYEPSGIVNRKQKRGNVFLKHCTDD